MSRKMWSLKEGNPREEEALLSTLSQTIVMTEKIIGMWFKSEIYTFL